MVLVCHYCFDKAFDKFYDMYNATWYDMDMFRAVIIFIIDQHFHFIIDINPNCITGKVMGCRYWYNVDYIYTYMLCNAVYLGCNFYFELDILIWFKHYSDEISVDIVYAMFCYSIVYPNSYKYLYFCTNMAIFVSSIIFGKIKISLKWWNLWLSEHVIFSKSFSLPWNHLIKNIMHF